MFKVESLPIYTGEELLVGNGLTSNLSPSLLNERVNVSHSICCKAAGHFILHKSAAAKFVEGREGNRVFPTF